jgi:glycosyltransferase involved in cell wall biosynthesis
MNYANRIVVIGHPFSTLGMGGQVRGGISALQSIGVQVEILDAYGYSKRDDPSLRQWLEPLETTDPNNAVRIFHINGDEVPPVIKHLETKYGFKWDSGPTIICPAWELPHYPSEWASNVNKFDRCWGVSKFVTKTLSSAVNIPVDWVGQAIDTTSRASLPRRYFDIRESSYVFLTFFDYSSYINRKNPLGTYQAFLKAFPDKSLSDVQLVIKTSGNPPEGDFLASTLASDNRVKIIAGKLNFLEMDSLIAASDALVSLHRAEGFGRGPAEALLRGKQVIATAYSGTEDYLTDENSFRIPYNLIPVKEGEYPFWENQLWADPDIDIAAIAMQKCYKNTTPHTPLYGAIDALTKCGSSPVGLRMWASINDCLKRHQQ